MAMDIKLNLNILILENQSMKTVILVIIRERLKSMKKLWLLILLLPSCNKVGDFNPTTSILKWTAEKIYEQNKKEEK